MIDIPLLHAEFGIPCIAVMRKLPNVEAFKSVALKLSDSDVRLSRIASAGPIHELEGFVFQCIGCDPRVAASALAKLTDQDQGTKIPECLRMAHLIGSALKTGQSSQRA